MVRMEEQDTMRRVCHWLMPLTVAVTLATLLASCASTTPEKKDEAEMIAEELEKIKERKPYKSRRELELEAREEAALKEMEERRRRQQRERGEVVGETCRLSIKASKDVYVLGEPIEVTITYKNLIDRHIRLVAEGESSDNAFSGEVIIIKRRGFEDSYSFVPLTTKEVVHRIRPGETWTRTIEDLNALLESKGAMRHQEPVVERDEEPPPPRFKKNARYTVQVAYYPNSVKDLPMHLDEDDKQTKRKELKKKRETLAADAAPTEVEEHLVSNTIRLRVKPKPVAADDE